MLAFQKEIKDMLDIEILVPSKHSNSVQTVMVPKWDGTNRTCNDYPKLNEITTKYAYPLLRIGQNIAIGKFQWQKKIVTSQPFVPRRVVFTNKWKFHLDKRMRL